MSKIYKNVIVNVPCSIYKIMFKYQLLKLNNSVFNTDVREDYLVDGKEISK